MFSVWFCVVFIYVSDLVHTHSQGVSFSLHILGHKTFSSNPSSDSYYVGDPT